MEIRVEKQLEDYYTEPGVWGDRAIEIIKKALVDPSFNNGKMPDLVITVTDATPPESMDHGNEYIFIMTIDADGEKDEYIDAYAEDGYMYMPEERKNFWNGLASVIKGWAEDEASSGDYVVNLEASFYMNRTWHYVFSACK
jgi:hypothetical protein